MVIIPVGPGDTRATHRSTVPPDLDHANLVNRLLAFYTGDFITLIYSQYYTSGLPRYCAN